MQYVRFPMSPAAREALLSDGTEVAIEIDHPSYQHRTTGPAGLRASLAADYRG